MKIKLLFSHKVIVFVCLVIVSESYMFSESGSPFGFYLYVKQFKLHFVTELQFRVNITHFFF
jgi:hypothetical protein